MLREYHLTSLLAIFDYSSLVETVGRAEYQLSEGLLNLYLLWDLSHVQRAKESLVD